MHEVDECRAQIDSLKQLLLQHTQSTSDVLEVSSSGETTAILSASEREQKLCELLRVSGDS